MKNALVAALKNNVDTHAKYSHSGKHVYASLCPYKDVLFSVPINFSHLCPNKDV